MARSLILFILLSVFSIGGCAFLGLSDESSEDPYAEDYDGSEEEEEGDEEEDYDEDEDIEEEEGEDYEDEEEEEEEESGGFFDWLFGSSDDEDEDDEEDEMGSGDDEMGTETEDGMGDGSTSDDDFYTDPIDEDPYGEGGDQIIPDDGTGMGEDSDSASSTSLPVPPQKKNIPLQKIRTSSYRKGDLLVNAVYIARQGENLQAVSSKIYGSDRTGELYKINSHLKSRGLKVGDKIYYNSPHRPEDNSKLLFYYQDINAQGSSYRLTAGSNIRRESTKLLGHANSWKEIWATNPDLISKGDIDRDLNIVYWPPGAEASAETGTEIGMETMPETEETTGTMGEEAPSPEGSDSPSDGSFPPESPPVPPEQEQGSAAFPPPPVPPTSAAVGGGNKSPFPPPIPPSEKPKTGDQGLVQSLLEQKGLILSLISIIVILILLIRLILKKRKQRDFDYTATNIEV